MVEMVLTKEPDHPECLAFVLLMVRLVGCTSCHSNSYRALRGCSYCTRHAVHRFRGSDDDLLTMFSDYLGEIEEYLESKGLKRGEQLYDTQ
jgi:hypothetical protein